MELSQNNIETLDAVSQFNTSYGVTRSFTADKALFKFQKILVSWQKDKPERN